MKSCAVDLASAWRERSIVSACVKLTQEMLTSRITVTVPTETLTFLVAKEIADDKAKGVSADAMLLAWFDKKTGEVSPRVECCREDKPGWLVYAESRGGKIVIDINDEEYVFIYCG
jgi:hypothetical protein